MHMNRTILLTVVLLIGVTLASRAQSAFLPRAPGIHVNTSYDEKSPVISPDGKFIYFSRTKHPENTPAKIKTAIWVVQSTAGIWGKPELVTTLNTGKENYVLQAFGDGKKLLIRQDKQLVVADQQESAWIITDTLSIPASEVTISNDGNAIFFLKKGVLMLTEKNEGTWGKPVAVKVEKSVQMKSPHLTMDGQWFYFSSPVKSQQDNYFRMERIGNGWHSFGMPVELNDSINSNEVEVNLRTTPNGAWGVFEREIKGEGCEIYLAKIFEDKPYVLFRGRILNSVSRKPILKREVKLFLDGIEANEYTVNRDSGTYSMKVPFGVSCGAHAEIAHFTPMTFTFSTDDNTEFTTKTVDLEMKPLPYVAVTGKMLIKNTDKPIPSKAKPTIVVDGIPVDSAQINLIKGTYSVNINHGSVYYVQVTAPPFESLPEILDLKEIDAFETIELNLHADADRMGLITGQVINKKTGNLFGTQTPVQIRVEGVSNPIVSLDSATSVYELRLPLKEKYVITATAPGYCPYFETIDLTKENRDITLTRPIVLVPFETGQSVRMNHVNFQIGKVVLEDHSYAELDRLVYFLQEHPSVKVEIGVHTDHSGKISTLKMAKLVTTYLISKGVAPNRVFARGYSSTKPIVPHSAAEATQLNRRVEYTILEK